LRLICNLNQGPIPSGSTQTRLKQIGVEFMTPPPAYPAQMPLKELRTAELLLTVTLRLFALAWRARGEAHPDWRGGMLAAGLAPDAIAAFDGLLAVVVVARRRPLEVGCPHCRALSHDEGRLLQMISLFQHGRGEAAEAVLDEWLPPSALRLAAASAQTLAQAMARADLIVPWRHAEAAHIEAGQQGYSRGLALVQ
jgi:hypothetical protein